MRRMDLKINHRNCENVDLKIFLLNRTTLVQTNWVKHVSENYSLLLLCNSSNNNSNNNEKWSINAVHLIRFKLFTQKDHKNSEYRKKVLKHGSKLELPIHHHHRWEYTLEYTLLRSTLSTHVEITEITKNNNKNKSNKKLFFISKKRIYIKEWSIGDLSPLKTWMTILN